MPKGLKNVFQAGCGAAETILGVPQTMKRVLIVGVSVMVVVVLVLVGTMAFGVGSGKIDVNQLASNVPKVIPV